jgi:hypothetical protein
LVTFCTPAWWRPVRSQLAKGEIASKDGQPRGGERVRQRHEKRGVAVRSRTVSQDKAIFTRTDRAMQEPSNGYFIRRSVAKLSIVVHAHAVTVNRRNHFSHFQAAISGSINS